MARDTGERGDPSTVAGQFPQDLGGGGGGGGGKSQPLKVATQQSGGINSRGGVVYVNDSKLGGTHQGYYLTTHGTSMALINAYSASVSGTNALSFSFNINQTGADGYFGGMYLFAQATPTATASTLRGLNIYLSQTGLSGSYFPTYQNEIIAGAKYGLNFQPTVTPAATTGVGMALQMPIQIVPGLFAELQPTTLTPAILAQGDQGALSAVNRQMFKTFNIFPHSTLNMNIQGAVLPFNTGFASADIAVSVEVREINFGQMTAVTPS